MKLFYKEQPVEDNKDLLTELELPGAEFAQILYSKISPIKKNVKIAYMEGEAVDGSKKQLFILLKLGGAREGFISADGCFSLSKYALEHIEKKYQLKDIKIKESNIEEAESKINPSIYKKAYEILKDFYVVDLDKNVEDKLGNNYRLVIVNNADLTIGEHLKVDELILFDGDKKIGYLKAKYTTPELMRLHGVAKENHFLNKSTIDFSNLEDDYKNKGLGYVMYFHMSQYLSSKGIKFRQSTLCSDSAQKLWEGINKHWSENVQIKKIENGQQKVNVSFLTIGKDCILSFKDNKPVIHKKKLE
jgi:ribonuclease HI